MAKKYRTYKDLEDTRTLDCSGVDDMRGMYFYRREIIHAQNTDFSGAVLYKCYIKSEIKNALNIFPVRSEKDMSFYLRGEDLRGCNLMGSDLRKADFSHAIMGPDADDYDEDYIVNLEAANLTKANLSGVVLNQGNLSSTILTEADLSESNLMMAELDHAILKNAKLVRANLYVATLVGADLRGANLEGAILNSADLSLAKYNSETNFDDSNITQEQLDSMIFVEDED